MEGLINKMKNTHRDPSLSPRGLAPGTAKRTSSKSHIPGGLLPGHGRIRSGPAASSLLLNKRFTLPFLALLAVLTAGLLLLLPGGPLHAQGAMTELEYAENGTDPVATYTGIDPEERLVYWLLHPPATAADLNNDGDISDAGEAAGDSPSADRDHFMISSDGVLSFKLPPNYETMGDADTNNVYEIVVVASDDAVGAGDMINMYYHKVTVTVTDVDEDGSISLSALQPQVGVELTATLTDPDSRSTPDDRPIDNETWKWEQSSAMDGPWTLIPGAGTGDIEATNTVKASDNYMPAKEIAGMYIRVTVTYTDKHGDDKTAMAVSAHMVRATPTGTNSVPSFPDTNAAQTREVDENSPPGTAIGKPVKASDTAGEILTYTLNGTDGSSFDINSATGQIMVGARTTLDEESKDSYIVEVTATDPSAEETASSVTVTITVKDVNEAPTITAGATKAEHDENTPTATAVSIYTATDVDQEISDLPLTWSVSGTDAEDFNISNAPTTRGELTFKKVPNYEMPADSNGGNTYMVTVVATDAGVDSKNKMTAERAVVVTVKNGDEDGMVAYSSVQPKVRIPFTASLTDPDGMTTDVKWQWWKTTSITETTAPLFPAAVNDGARGGWEEIDDAETNIYTPVSGDIGRWLAAVATYTDPTGPGQIAESATDSNDVRSDNEVDENKDNVAPEFLEGGKEPVMQATRYVLETAAAGGSVVVNSDGDTAETTTDPVAATDPNDREGISSDDSEGILNYTLGGRDKDSFAIAQATGQITVGADTKLDYESNKKSYMVTVTAADPSQAMTTIDVTIMVVDADEAPEFTGSFAGDEPFTGTIREENTNLRVATLTASSRDKGQPKVYWSLKEDGDYTDDEHFQIDVNNGVLSFKSSPDYENPRGAALAADSNNNTYKVIVVASDDAPGANGTAGEVSGQMADKKVEITVTEMEEDGVVNLSARYAQVEVQITATLTDDDVEDASGTITGAASLTWQWYKGSSGTIEAEGTGNDGSALTPDASDAGTVRAVASYTDAGGEPRTVSKPVSVRQAPADQDDDPTFPAGSNARTVKENMRADTNVGSPVKAQDDDTADNTKLTYDLTDDGNGNFKINPANGQLTTTRVLNREGTNAAAGEGPSYNVTVTATDPGGRVGTQNVAITVENVNEGPMITVGETRQDYAEKLQAETLTAVDTYTASDPETTDDDDLVWSLTGPDASDFNIGNQEGATTLGELTFKEKPDFEKPVDANKDNVYMVTVKVTDDGKLTGTRQMVVTVTNVSEDGTIKLSAIQPKTGIGLMASLTDPDFITSTNTDGSMETGVTWQWWRTDDVVTEGTALPGADADGDRAGWGKIDDAETDTYTPVSGDIAYGLAAVATYTDPTGTGESANKHSDNPVIINNDNVGPVFKDDNDEEITETTRKVAEDAKPNAETGTSAETTRGDVGDPVMATDPNDSDLLTYTLSGPDMALFKIKSDEDIEEEMRGGQISLNANTELDYEDRTTYMVTVTAADPDGEMASVDVTIMVTGVDEAPKIIAGGLVVRGTSDTNYAENGMGMVATYSAAGPDAANATWSLSGADAGALSISSAGVLTFMDSPNYESPADANTDNIYMVMVNANDGTTDAMKAVTVRVTNVDELGMLVGQDSGGYMENDTVAVGTYTADGPVTPTWSVEGDDMEAFTIGGSSGELMFASPPDFEAPADMGMDNVYQVTVKAEAGGEMDMITVTITVTNEEETGEVTLWAGTDALTMAPQVGDIITGAVMDPDGGVTVTSWQWAKSMTPDMMESWMDITGATDAAYMVMGADNGYYLRATAMYTDGEGTGKMASEKTMMVIMNASPMFDTETAERMVPENTAAGENVGEPVTAMDADNDTLTYTLGGTDMASFNISADGQLMTQDALDYETKNSYEVMVTATDPDSASDMITVTITVTNEEETGEVTLWLGTDALTMAPQVGDTITGAVMDPDGNPGDMPPIAMDTTINDVTWQWSRTMDAADMTSWMDIEDATGAAYIVMEGDTGYHLRVMASYADGEGSGKSAMAESDAVAGEESLLDRYDADDNGEIEIGEARTAVAAYFRDEITLEDARAVVALYFASP